MKKSAAVVSTDKDDRNGVTISFIEQKFLSHSLVDTGIDTMTFKRGFKSLGASSFPPLIL